MKTSKATVRTGSAKGISKPKSQSPKAKPARPETFYMKRIFHNGCEASSETKRIRSRPLTSHGCGWKMKLGSILRNGTVGDESISSKSTPLRRKKSDDFLVSSSGSQQELSCSQISLDFSHHPTTGATSCEESRLSGGMDREFPILCSSLPIFSTSSVLLCNKSQDYFSRLKNIQVEHWRSARTVCANSDLKHAPAHQFLTKVTAERFKTTASNPVTTTSNESLPESNSSSDLSSDFPGVMGENGLDFDPLSYRPSSDAFSAVQIDDFKATMPWSMFCEHGGKVYKDSNRLSQRDASRNISSSRSCAFSPFSSQSNTVSRITSMHSLRGESIFATFPKTNYLDNDDCIREDKNYKVDCSCEMAMNEFSSVAESASRQMFFVEHEDVMRMPGKKSLVSCKQHKQAAPALCAFVESGTTKDKQSLTGSRGAERATVERRAAEKHVQLNINENSVHVRVPDEKLNFSLSGNDANVYGDCMVENLERKKTDFHRNESNALQEWVAIDKRSRCGSFIALVSSNLEQSSCFEDEKTRVDMMRRTCRKLNLVSNPCRQRKHSLTDSYNTSNNRISSSGLAIDKDVRIINYVQRNRPIPTCKILTSYNPGKPFLYSPRLDTFNPEGKQREDYWSQTMLTESCQSKAGHIQSSNDHTSQIYAFKSVHGRSRSDDIPIRYAHNLNKIDTEQDLLVSNASSDSVDCRLPYDRTQDVSTTSDCYLFSSQRKHFRSSSAGNDFQHTDLNLLPSKQYRSPLGIANPQPSTFSKPFLHEKRPTRHRVGEGETWLSTHCSQHSGGSNGSFLSALSSNPCDFPNPHLALEDYKAGCEFDPNWNNSFNSMSYEDWRNPNFCLPWSQTVADKIRVNATIQSHEPTSYQSFYSNHAASGNTPSTCMTYAFPTYSLCNSRRKSKSSCRTSSCSSGMMSCSKQSAETQVNCDQPTSSSAYQSWPHY